MSLRAVRKVKEKSDLSGVANASSDDEEEEEPRQATPPSRQGNMFSFFQEESDEDDDDAEEEQNQDDQEQEVEQTPTIVEHDHKPQKEQSSSNKSSKKKKKRRKRKSKNKKKIVPKSLNEEKQQHDDDMLAIEEHLKRMNPHEEIKTNSEEILNFQKSILRIEPKDFNHELELRQMFGKDALKTEEKENASTRSHHTQRRNANKLRRTVLTKPADDWPPLNVAGVASGLSMELLSTDKNGVKTFKWEFSEEYKHVQELFELRARTHDPQQISYLLRDYPYHIDTLLVMSDIMKQHGEFSEASSYVERALYRYECAFHASYRVAQGNCRMSYKDPDNRSFFLAIYRHIQYLGRRGCPRTALAFSKLLLSLSPEADPMCCLLTMDYFAIRAKEYKFLLDFCEIWRHNDAPARLLPNFAFSCALSQWYIQDDNEVSPGEVICNVDFTGDLGCSVLLQQALLLFPEMIGPLVGKASSRELKKERWKTVLKHKHFIVAKLRRSDNPTIGKLVSIYVERTHPCWRSDKIMEWLLNHAEAVLHKLDSGQLSQEMGSFDLLRTSVYDSSDNPYAKLEISEFSDTITTLPQDELPQPIQPQNPQGLQLNAVLDGTNPLGALLLSLLPWVNVHEDGRNGDQNQN